MWRPFCSEGGSSIPLVKVVQRSCFIIMLPTKMEVYKQYDELSLEVVRNADGKITKLTGNRKALLSPQLLHCGRDIDEEENLALASLKLHTEPDL